MKYAKYGMKFNQGGRDLFYIIYFFRNAFSRTQNFNEHKKHLRSDKISRLTKPNTHKYTRARPS